MQNILYKKSVLTKAVASICLQQGWYGVTNIALDTLTDLLEEYIIIFAKSTKQFAELSYRTEPVLGDLEICFENYHVNTSDLLEYLLSLDNQNTPLNVPNFPASQSILSDPVHLPLSPNNEEKTNELMQAKSDESATNDKRLETNLRRQANIRALPEEIIQSTYEMKCFTTDDCEDNFPLFPGHLPIATYPPMSSSENEQSDIEDTHILPLDFPQYEPIAKNTEEEFKEFKLKIEPVPSNQRPFVPSTKNKKKQTDYDPPFNVHQQKSLLKIGSRGFGRSRGRRGRRGGMSRGAAIDRIIDDDGNAKASGKNRLTAGELEQSIKNKWASIRTGRVKKIASLHVSTETIIKVDDNKEEDASLKNICGDVSDRISDINDEEIAEAADAVESPQLIFDTPSFDVDKIKFDGDDAAKKNINSETAENSLLKIEASEMKIENDNSTLARENNAGLTWTDEDEDRSPIKFSPSYLNFSPVKESNYAQIDSDHQIEKENFNDEEDYDYTKNESEDVENENGNLLSNSAWPKVYVKPLSPTFADQYKSPAIDEYQPPLKKIKIGFSAGSECSIKQPDGPSFSKASIKKKKKKRNPKSKSIEKDQSDYKGEEESKDLEETIEDEVNAKLDVYDESDSGYKIYDESDESVDDGFDTSVQWEVVREEPTPIIEKTLSKKSSDKILNVENKELSRIKYDDKSYTDKSKSKIDDTNCDTKSKNKKKHKTKDIVNKNSAKIEDRKKLITENEKFQKNKEKSQETSEKNRNKNSENAVKVKDHVEINTEIKRSDKHKDKKLIDLKIDGGQKDSRVSDFSSGVGKDSSKSKKKKVPTATLR